MEKRWSKTEIAHLKRHAGAQSAQELAQRLHTDGETVRRKLEELGLGSADAPPGAANDASLEDYSRALELLHESKWQEAGDLLEQVAAQAREIQLADRARQHLAICRHQLETVKDSGDPYLRAVFEKNRGNLDAALELCEGEGAEDEERYAYLIASIRALGGAEDQALEHLATAIRLDPRNRIHAYHDPDFQELRGLEEFANLVQPS